MQITIVSVVFRVYGGGKVCCYRMMTCFSACCVALMWGWCFAVVTYCQVWYCTPFLRVFAINMGCCQKLYGVCVQCVYAPLYETYALCLSRIGINLVIRKLGSSHEQTDTESPSPAVREKQRSFVTPF